MEIVDIIRDYYGVELERWDGLRVSRHHNKQYPSESIKIDEFSENVTIEEIGNEITWNFTVPQHIEERTSLKSSNQGRVLRRQHAYKLRHEFVAECISAEYTDVPLRRMFDPLFDSDDVLTPDWMFTDAEGITHVIELGTFRNSNVVLAKNEVDKKLFKYTAPLSNRSLNRISTLTAIIVTNEYVMSNIILPQRIVDDLCARMLISIALENCATGKGIDLKCGSNITESEKIAEEIGINIGKIEMAFQPVAGLKVPITQEYYNKVMTHQPDIKLVTKLYLNSRLEAMDRPIKPPHANQVQKYLESFENPLNARHESKPICILPLLVLKQSLDSTFNVLKPAGGNAPSHLTSLWKTALSQAHNNPQYKERSLYDTLSEAYCVDNERIDELAQLRLKSRDKYHRVDMSSALTPQIRRELQKDGVFGKSAKDNIIIQSVRDRKKKSFMWTTDVKDIDSLVDDQTLYDLQDEVPWCQDKPLELLEEAHKLAGNKHFELCIIKEWMKTNWFRSLDVISDIATELSLSIKQNTRGDEMILKKVKNYPLYLLIKTTNSDSHLFFSILVPSKTEVCYLRELPFRGLHKTMCGYVSDFVSVKKSKLGNLLNASCRFLTLVSFWSDFYGISSLRLSEFRSNKEAMRMLNISMMVSLENKAETEESITQTRYMYMEIFKSVMSHRRPDPMKILTKLTTKPRSRLNLWVLLKIVQRFNSMCVRPPVRVPLESRADTIELEDTQPGDKWENLINFFTGGCVSSATGVVQLMYLGYLKDKNEEAEGNSEWALVEKIVEEEIKLKKSKKREQYGDIKEDDPPPKGKGFSLDAVLLGVNFMKDRLRSKLGPDWKVVLNREILLNLARQLTHEIATLKASSKIEHRGVGRGTATIQDQKHVARVKVLEALASRIGMVGLNPMLHLEDILKLVETTTRGVVCDLFKKQQHGGIREIYVLTIESRILQLFIETISRTICDKFEEETLTHPENKLKNLDEHKTRSYRIAKARASVFADFCSSSDKTRWNQNFLMTAMCVPILQLTMQNLHPAIIRVMNLWSNKLIKLPPFVIKLLMEKKQLSSETYKTLYKKFYGMGDKDCDTDLLNSPRSAFMRLTTGMMQGILHYTSSLLHVCFLQVAKFMTISTLKKSHEGKEMRFTMTSVCSSDDSATILTAFSKKSAEDFLMGDFMVFMDCGVSLECLTIFCQYFCMVESAKSTIGLYDYVEFNSEFIFKNTIAMPVIKFVAACLTISESESFINRQYELYNLISSLSSAGFPSMNTYMCQLAQGLLHYKSMGPSTSSVFPHYADEIKTYPDPVHGFFLLDKDILCGVLGHSYSRWMALQGCPLLRAGTASHEGKELSVMEDGTIVDSLVVRHGEHKRWYKLLDRVVEGSIEVKKPSLGKNKDGVVNKVNKEVLDERIKMVNSIPELLYRHPENEKELKVKLMCKALSPGVSKSLQVGNPLTESFAATAYMLYSHCFTRTTTEKRIIIQSTVQGSKETRVKRTERFSLLSSLRERKQYANKVMRDGSQLLSLEILFPLHHCFEDAEEVFRTFDNYQWVPTHEMRQKKNIIRILPRTDKLPFSLMQILTAKWFNFSIKASRNVVERCFKEYKAEFPWISEDFEQTLSNSPFELHTELHGFISSQTRKQRRFVKVGPAITTERFSHQIYQMVRKCSLRKFLLEQIGMSEESRRGLPVTVSTEGLTRERLESELSLALFIPVPHIRERNVVQCLSKLAKSKPSIQDWMDCPKWEFEVGLIALYQNGNIRKEEVLEAMRAKGAGIRIVFTKVQVREESPSGDISWVGSGQCVVDAEGIEMKVEISDQTVRRVWTREPDKLRRNPELLQEVFKRLGCTRSTVSAFEPRIVYRFNGTRFEHQSCEGTPVIHDPDLSLSFTYTSQVKFKIGMGVCGLTCIESGRTFPLINFRSKKWACTTRTINNEPIDDFWKAWVSQSPATVAGAMRSLIIIDKHLKDTEIPNHEREMLRGWAKESLENRLKYKGIGLISYDYTESVVTSVADDPYDEDEFDEWACDFYLDTEKLNDVYKEFTAGLLDNYIDEVANDMEVENAADEDIVMFESLFSPANVRSPYRPVVSNWVQEEAAIDRSVLTKEHLNYYALHPIWDQFISELLKQDVRFFEKLMSGVVPAVEREMSSILSEILMIKPREAERSMMERFIRGNEGTEHW